MGAAFAITAIRPLSRLESGDITVPGTTLVISGNQEGRVEAWEINTFCGTVPLDHLGNHSPRYHPLEKETYSVLYDSITAITTVPSQVFPGAMSFVTGSANGSVKVWGVDKCTLREVDDQTIFEFEDIPTAKPVRSLLTVGKTIIAGITRI
jgi:WD40 repeat protein